MDAHQSLPEDIRRLLFDAEDPDGLTEAWQISGQIPTEDFPHRDRVDQMRKVLRDHSLNTEAPTEAPIHWMGRFRPLLRVAAILLIGLVGAYMLTSPVTVEVSEGSTEIVSLPDGSNVAVYGGSSLIYRKWPFNRTVKLDGEARFDVETSSEPFTVSSAAAEVEVLGTVFVVRDYSAQDGAGASIALEEGSVKVSSDLGVDVQLRPGQVAFINASGAVTQSADTDEFAVATSRAAGTFYVRNEPVHQVIDEIALRYGSSLTGVPTNLLDASITVNLTGKPDAASVVTTVCSSIGLTCQKDSDGDFVVR